MVDDSVDESIAVLSSLAELLQTEQVVAGRQALTSSPSQAPQGCQIHFHFLIFFHRVSFRTGPRVLLEAFSFLQAPRIRESRGPSAPRCECSEVANF